MPWNDGKTVLYTWTGNDTRDPPPVTFYYGERFPLSTQTERLIEQFRGENENLNDCLFRLLTVLVELTDKLEGYRTGGIAL